MSRQDDLDVEANEPRVRSAMSAIGALDDEPAQREFPIEPVHEFDNGSRMIKFTRMRSYWLIEPEGYLPRSDFDRYVRCLRAEGVYFNRPGCPRNSWSVTVEDGARVSFALINSGFSTGVSAVSQSPPLSASLAPPTSVTTAGSDGDSDKGGTR